MWRDTYDKVNLTNDGITVIFDGHYSLTHSKKILINEEEASEEEIKEFNKVEHVWVHFGLINLEGEVISGWSILGEKPKSMKGCITATIISKSINPKGKGRGK